jgi:hypothetical protein
MPAARRPEPAADACSTRTPPLRAKRKAVQQWKARARE